MLAFEINQRSILIWMKGYRGGISEIDFTMEIHNVTGEQFSGQI